MFCWIWYLTTILISPAQAKSGELSYLRDQVALELSREREFANIEVKKFAKMVSAIGADTLQAIATSGPDMQV